MLIKKVFVNHIFSKVCSKKYKKIVKFNLKDYNPTSFSEKQKMEFILENVNHDIPSLKFYFNHDDNSKNPNKH